MSSGARRGHSWNSPRCDSARRIASLRGLFMVNPQRLGPWRAARDSGARGRDDLETVPSKMIRPSVASGMVVEPGDRPRPRGWGVRPESACASCTTGSTRPDSPSRKSRRPASLGDDVLDVERRAWQGLIHSAIFATSAGPIFHPAGRLLPGPHPDSRPRSRRAWARTREILSLHSTSDSRPFALLVRGLMVALRITIHQQLEPLVGPWRGAVAPRRPPRPSRSELAT